MDKNCTIIYVEGVVQGVGFRMATKKKADAIGLNGSVANLTDGQVKIVISGSPEQQQQFIEWLKQGGPPLAKISNFTIVHDKINDGAQTTFVIK